MNAGPSQHGHRYMYEQPPPPQSQYPRQEHPYWATTRGRGPETGLPYLGNPYVSAPPQDQRYYSSDLPLNHDAHVPFDAYPRNPAQRYHYSVPEAHARYPHPDIQAPYAIPDPLALPSFGPNVPVPYPNVGTQPGPPHPSAPTGQSNYQYANPEYHLANRAAPPIEHQRGAYAAGYTTGARAHAPQTANTSTLHHRSVVPPPPTYPSARAPAVETRKEQPRPRQAGPQPNAPPPAAQYPFVFGETAPKSKKSAPSRKPVQKTSVPPAPPPTSTTPTTKSTTPLPVPSGPPGAPDHPSEETRADTNSASRPGKKYNIPEGATAESLLASGFIPPLTAIGNDLNQDEGEAIFRLLPRPDRKAILEAFLQDYNAMDVDLEQLPVFTMGSASLPNPSHGKTSARRKGIRKEVVPDRPNTSQKTAHFNTTVEEADSSDDDDTCRIPSAAKGKTRAQDFSFDCNINAVDKDTSGRGPASQASPDSAHYSVVILDAVHAIKEGVDRRLDNMETVIEGINVKIEDWRIPPASQSTQALRARKPRARTVASRIARANGDDREDFTQEMAGVFSGDGNTAQSAPNRTEVDENTEAVFLHRLRTCVRKHFDQELLQIQNMKQLPGRCPALTEDEAESVSQSPEPVITSRGNFRFDPSRGWNSFRLNQEAANFFLTDFANVVKGGGYLDPPIPARYLTREQVSIALDRHVTYLRSEFVKLTMAPTEKNKAKRLAEVLRKRAASRRRSTLEQRRETVTDPCHGLRRHVVLLSKLMPKHVSPDEPVVPNNRHCRTFHILEAKWQSQAYKRFMRSLDELRAKAREVTIGDHNSGGNVPRSRVELLHPKLVDSPAPKGLWRNCYDSEWLGQLQPYQYAALQVVEADYDFSLDRRPDDFD